MHTYFDGRIIDYHLKCRMVEQRCKNNITGRKSWERGLQVPPTNVQSKVALEDNHY